MNAIGATHVLKNNSRLRTTSLGNGTSKGNPTGTKLEITAWRPTHVTTTVMVATNISSLFRLNRKRFSFIIQAVYSKTDTTHERANHQHLPNKFGLFATVEEKT